MAAQVLDEFVVKLGFDVAALSKGQAETLSRLDGLEKKADHTRRSVQESGKGMGETFSAVRNQVFALTSAFIGFNALKTAVVDITKADAALGRLSRNLGAAPKDLKAFQGVAAKFGSSAEDMSDAFQHTADVIAEFRNQGTVSPAFLFNMGQAQIDYTKFFAKETDDIERWKMVQTGLNDAIDSGRRTRAEALLIGQGMGYSPATVTMMIETKGRIDDLVAAQAKLNEVNDADTAQAQIRAEAWNTVTNTMEHYYRSAINGVTELMSAEARAARVKEGQTPWSPVSQGNEWLLTNNGAPAGAPSPQVSTGTISRPSETNAGGATPFTPSEGAHRNERNNNPGNIKYGQFARSHGATGSDGRFAIFPDLTTGTAAQRDLMAYHGAHGARTIRDLIMKWAPPSENESESYIAEVAAQSGVPATAAMNYGDPAMMSAVQLAMARREGMSPRGLSAMQGVIAPARTGVVAGGGTTTVTNTTTNHINAGNADARELAGLLENRYTANANALAMGNL